MKKSILLLIPLMLGLTSCGGQPVDTSSQVPTDTSSSEPSVEPGPDPEIIPNQEDVDKIKELLSKQDLSKFYTKSLKGIYSQEYDVLEISNEEEVKTSNYLNYGGYGIFGFYYDLTSEQYDSIVDEKGDIDTFDAIATGTGSYGLLNVTRTMSFSREGSWESEINNLDIYQSSTLKTTEQDVWVDNTLNVSDTGIFHYESNQYLSASINKELLFSSVSTRTFRDIFSKVNLFDTPGNIEHLDKLYFSICHELVSKNDKGISDFLLENQISIEEKEDNIELNFVFNTEDVEEEEADYIFPGAIKGTLFFDKVSYQFSDFNYEMQYRAETYDEGSGDTKLINIKFTCEGVSTRELPEDPWEPTDPVIYDDVAEFLKDVNEQVVPPEIIL